MTDKPTRSPAENKILKDFAARLEKACDDSPHVPEKGKGRQLMIAEMLGVSQEAARKYFAGLSLPRPVKMQLLAEKLEFVVPREYPDLRCIGFVQTNSPFSPCLI